ncbi:prepilin peptidase [Deltaproteobacteria bacterium IMCC39524]|nr:prepilin peptidase [Deltaproteobacteria bacterium IMCC39524]
MHAYQYSLLLLFTFILGSVIGSFLNVCIYRIPAGLSIVTPRSRCPHCETPIRWYHNIPILSWVLLKGKCAYCSAEVPVRYLLVEALTGVLFVLFFYRFAFHPVTPVILLLVATLVVITFIDLDHQIIPDVISLPGIPIGFLCSFLMPWVTWPESLVGILLGGGSLLTIALGYELLTGKEGMGFGDVKLLAMLGAFLGWTAIFPIIFIGSTLGTLVGVPLMLFKKADSKLAIPFGPFLAAGALIHIFFVDRFDPIMRWYASMLKQLWLSF